MEEEGSVAENNHGQIGQLKRSRPKSKQESPGDDSEPKVWRGKGCWQCSKEGVLGAGKPLLLLCQGLCSGQASQSADKPKSGVLNEAQQQVFKNIKQKVGTSQILTNPVKHKPLVTMQLETPWGPWKGWVSNM